MKYKIGDRVQLKIGNKTYYFRNWIYKNKSAIILEIVDDYYVVLYCDGIRGTLNDKWIKKRIFIKCPKYLKNSK